MAGSNPKTTTEASTSPTTKKTGPGFLYPGLTRPILHYLEPVVAHFESPARARRRFAYPHFQRTSPLQRHLNRTKKMNDQIENVEARVQRLEEQLQRSEAKNGEHLDTIRKRDNHIAFLTTQLRRQTEQTEGEIANYVRLEEQITGLQDKQREALGKITKKDDEIQGLKTEARDREAHIDYMNGQFEKLEAEVEQYKRERENLSKLVETRNNEAAKEKERAESIKTQYDGLVESAKGMSGEVANREAAIAKLSADREQLMRETQSLKDENAKFQEALEEKARMDGQLAKFEQDVEPRFNREPGAYIAAADVRDPTDLSEELTGVSTSGDASQATSISEKDQSDDERSTASEASEEDDEKGQKEEDINEDEKKEKKTFGKQKADAKGKKKEGVKEKKEGVKEKKEGVKEKKEDDAKQKTKPEIFKKPEDVKREKVIQVVPGPTIYIDRPVPAPGPVRFLERNVYNPIQVYVDAYHILGNLILYRIPNLIRTLPDQPEGYVMVPTPHGPRAMVQSIIDDAGDGAGAAPTVAGTPPPLIVPPADMNPGGFTIASDAPFTHTTVNNNPAPRGTTLDDAAASGSGSGSRPLQQAGVNNPNISSSAIPPPPPPPPRTTSFRDPPPLLPTLLILLSHLLICYLLYTTARERSLWYRANGLTRDHVWEHYRLAERKHDERGIYASSSTASSAFGSLLDGAGDLVNGVVGGLTHRGDQLVVEVVSGGLELLGVQRRGWVVPC